jgi:hypothetical protein
MMNGSRAGGGRRICALTTDQAEAQPVSPADFVAATRRSRTIYVVPAHPSSKWTGRGVRIERLRPQIHDHQLNCYSYVVQIALLMTLLRSIIWAWGGAGSGV